MRDIAAQDIHTQLAKGLYLAVHNLPECVESKLQAAARTEQKPIAQSTLHKILENAAIARKETIPICQDTGTAIVFVDIGQDVHIIDGDLDMTINNAVREAYQTLRASIVADPLRRTNTKDNTPAVIHTRIVPGDTLTITALAKGGGAENKSRLQMFVPNTTIPEISQFIVETIKKADAAACPPLIVGVGLGGTFESCPLLAKRALTREVGTVNEDPYYAELEQQMLSAINALGIGPAGYGGDTTALAVHINAAPCHIASLPVAVNIQCHADRLVKIRL
jgi:fumarate hydratase subunit alpha